MLYTILNWIRIYILVGLLNGLFTVTIMSLMFKHKQGFVDLAKWVGHESDILTINNIENAEAYYEQNWFAAIKLIIKSVILWPKDIIGYHIRKSKRTARQKES